MEDKKVVLLVGGLDEKGYTATVEKNLTKNLLDSVWKIVYTGGRYIPDDHGLFIRKLMAKINQTEESVYKEKWGESGISCRRD